MKIDEKRQVIEVLLCAAIEPDSVFNVMGTWDAARFVGCVDGVAMTTHQLWMRCRTKHGVQLTHGTVCLEAAYRLIESSPTLRREWFGR